MSLLNNLMAHPLDEGYAVAARARRPQGETPKKSHRIILVIALLFLGFLLAVAASQNYRSAPEAEKQRKELITRINQADGRLNDLRTRQTKLADEVRGLQAGGLSNTSEGAALQQKLDDLRSRTPSRRARPRAPGDTGRGHRPAAVSRRRHRRDPRYRIRKSGRELISQIWRGDVEIARKGVLVNLRQERIEEDEEKSARRKRCESDIRKVTIEQRGPLRAVVRIEGVHANKRGRSWFSSAPSGSTCTRVRKASG